MSAQKNPQGSKTKEVAGGTEEKTVSQMRGHLIELQAIKLYLPAPQYLIVCALPGGTPAVAVE